MFAALYAPRVERAPALLSCARAFSPRVEVLLGGRLVLIDVAGLGRIVGDAETIAAEVRAAVSRATRDVPHVTVSIAPSRLAALLLAVAERDVVVPPGRAAAVVGAVSLDVLASLAALRESRAVPRGRLRPCALCELARAKALCGKPGGACTELATLRRWGLSTLGDLAALPSAELSARLGQMGVVLQQLARGLDTQPLVPVVEAARFEASIDLEWPIDDLQPLSFVLARLLDPLSAALERADRGASAIVTELTLVRLPASEDASRTHVRRLELPAPMRDPRVLRTLILLDLESHPPPAGIDRVAIRVEPTPARIVQFSLLERAGPRPETIATLVSRLSALMGEGRVGSPVLLDSHAPDAFALESFRGQGSEATGQRPGASGQRPEARGQRSEASGQTSAARGQRLARHSCSPLTADGSLPSDPWPLVPVLRRFRLPVAARVVLSGDRLVRVTTDRLGIKGGDVRQCAGPWRSSGNWWSACGPREEPEGSSERGARDPRARASGWEAPRALDHATDSWDRDEYDVALGDGAAYRVYRDRHEDRWFVEGILD